MAGVVVWGLVSVPVALPVLSLSRADDLGLLELNEELAEEVGWPDLVDQVDAVLDDLPPARRDDVRVLTPSYGEAAAVELLGTDRGIPEGTVLSGHNSFVTWWPDDGPTPTSTVVTDRFRSRDLDELFETCTVVDTVANDHDVENEVVGSPIMVCEGLTVTGHELRTALERVS